MADHYPKQRHRPAPPAPPVEPTELSDAAHEAVAEQRALFLEYFGQKGYTFFSALYSEGMIEGWRSVRDVHKFNAPCPADDDTDFQFAEPDFQPYPSSLHEDHN